MSYVWHAAACSGCWTWLSSSGFPLGGRYAAIRVILAAILISAAVLKGYQLATGPVLGTGLFSSRILLIAVVEFGWVVGARLLAGQYAKWTSRMMRRLWDTRIGRLYNTWKAPKFHSSHFIIAGASHVSRCRIAVVSQGNTRPSRTTAVINC